MNFTIKPGMSKAEEKALFTRLVEYTQAHAGETYLSSLLTEELAEWTNRRIDEDVCPDVLAFWRFEVGQINTTLKTVLEQEITARKQAELQATRLTSMLSERDDQIQFLRLTVGTHRERADSWMSAAMNSENLNTDLTSQLEFVNARRAELDNEITRLKAKMFDMQEEIEALKGQ